MALAVRAMIAGAVPFSPQSLRIISAASMPSITGIIWSMKMMSYRFFRTSSIASGPLSASVRSRA